MGSDNPSRSGRLIGFSADGKTASGKPESSETSREKLLKGVAAARR
jgi:hypothetical protein